MAEKMADTTVCIVGAGPSGLVTALGLARSGIPFVLLDADEGPTVESRALNVHPGAMMVFEHLGLADRFLDVGIEVRRLRISTGRSVLAEFVMGEVAKRYPFSLHVRQQTTEEILYEQLADLGHGPLAQHTVTAVTEGANSYEITGHSMDGRPFAVGAQYVVGADGIRSVVRRAMGVAFPSRIYALAFLVADVDLGSSAPDKSVSYVDLSKHGLLFYAPLSGGNWRVLLSVRTAVGHKPEPPTETELKRLLDERAPGLLRVRRMVASNSFIFQHGVADRFVHHRMALVGDAAHVHSPAGGMGMNTGVQDGYDIAATLAAIVRGAKAHEALAAYNRRRRAAGLEVVRFSDRLMTVLALQGPVAHTIRGLGFRAVGRVAPLRRRVALTTSCLTRTPWSTGAPELPCDPRAAIGGP